MGDITHQLISWLQISKIKDHIEKYSLNVTSYGHWSIVIGHMSLVTCHWFNQIANVIR